MGARLLVAEDDLKQAELIRRYLERDGHTVVVVHDGRAAIDECRRRPPDLALLDIMMPKVDGLDACRILRATADIPIIFLTARTTEDDVLLGLDLGADDYMTRPFSPRELVARVRTVLRRTRPDVVGRTREVVRVHGIEIDLVRHEVRLDGSLVDCTVAEVKILATLAAEPGRAFTRQRLLQAAFGADHYALDRTIDVHVMNLRKKLERDPSRPEHLLTVYGVGYKMAEPSGTDPSARGPR
ncbi:MAG: response regulator transcription factor [Actinobacteria bacterium]|nr:response regulator transcription factor [Actinomycetota bacterium]